MKFNYTKFMLSLLMMTASFASFAQTPEPPDDGDPPASINSKLLWLVIAGIAFAYYQFNLRRKRA